MHRILHIILYIVMIYAQNIIYYIIYSNVLLLFQDTAQYCEQNEVEAKRGMYR